MPGWVLVTDAEGNYHWVNEEQQLLETEPPNVDELKEMFQKLRREYIKKKNNPEAPSTAQKKSEQVPGRTQHSTNSTPDALRLTAEGHQRLSPVTFELTNTEPRQTYEQSRAKLDPRQALFESKENTLKDQLADHEDLSFQEVRSQEELSQRLSSQADEKFGEPGQQVRDSNYQVFEQLQSELQTVKQMYEDLVHENKSLKSAQERLANDREENIKQPSDHGRIEERMPESPRFRDNRAVFRKREEYLGESMGNEYIENELQQIRRLLENSIKIQTENIDRQRQATLQNSQYVQGQRMLTENTSKGKTESMAGGLPQNPYRMPNKDDSRVVPISGANTKDRRKPSQASSSLKRDHDSHRNLTDSMAKFNSRPEFQGSSQQSSGKVSKDSLSSDFMNKKKRWKEKLTALGVTLYHKWKDIIGMEHNILCQTTDKLERERIVLKHRKAAVQKYEWDMLWSIRDDLDKEASKRIIDDIKHTIFGYELEAEKVSSLTSILQVRIKKMKLVERALDFSMKSGHMDEKTDDYLTDLFSQYIEIANIYEHRLRINTRSLNPYQKSQQTSDFLASYKGGRLNFASSHPLAAHQSQLDQLYSKLQQSKSTVDPATSHADFLRQTLSKVREAVPADSSVFADICSYFESQSAWFDAVNTEIKNVMRKLTNPQNISALH